MSQIGSFVSCRKLNMFYNKGMTNTKNIPDTMIICPVEQITGIWNFKRPPLRNSVAVSTPGHLFHLIVKGHYHLTIGSRSYHVKEGDFIYYHESETVLWRGEDTEVEFYSIGFLATSIEPPDADKRVFAANRTIKKAFQNIYENACPVSTQSHLCLVYSEIFSILHEIAMICSIATEPRLADEHLWRFLEDEIRKRRSFRASLGDLAKWANCCRSTVVRACRNETGKSPMGRLRLIRMAEAKGLLKFSSLNITQIAQYLGYPRIHEFSREYKSFFNKTPGEEKHINI